MFMGGKAKKPLDIHVRFNGRNPRHVQAAEILATVPTKYKTAFLTVAIESYMASRYPPGVNMDDLVAVQKETDRSFQPKAPIQENLKRAPARASAHAAPPPEAKGSPGKPEDDNVINAIDKAMAAFGVK